MQFPSFIEICSSYCINMRIYVIKASYIIAILRIVLCNDHMKIHAINETQMCYNQVVKKGLYTIYQIAQGNNGNKALLRPHLGLINDVIRRHPGNDNVVEYGEKAISSIIS